MELIKRVGYFRKRIKFSQNLHIEKNALNKSRYRPVYEVIDKKFLEATRILQVKIIPELAKRDISNIRKIISMYEVNDYIPDLNSEVTDDITKQKYIICYNKEDVLYPYQFRKETVDLLDKTKFVIYREHVDLKIEVGEQDCEINKEIIERVEKYPILFEKRVLFYNYFINFLNLYKTNYVMISFDNQRYIFNRGGYSLEVEILSYEYPSVKLTILPFRWLKLEHPLKKEVLR